MTTNVIYMIVHLTLKSHDIISHATRKLIFVVYISELFRIAYWLLCNLNKAIYIINFVRHFYFHHCHLELIVNIWI